jgi:integrase
MLTIKAEIQRDKLRQDGTYNVKIRFTKGKQVKRLSTSLFVTKADLTDRFTIKEDSLIKQKADKLILHYRTMFNEMHLETEALDVNEIVARLTSREESNKPVDFIQFAKEWIANSTLKGAANYTSALNSLIRFNKSEKLYTHQITSDFLQDFMNFLLNESKERSEMLKKKGKRVPSTRCTSLYLMSIRKLFNEAVKQYNKPDQGLIRIKNTPFAYFHITKQEATRKRAITAEQIRKMIQLPYQTVYKGIHHTNRFNLAKDCFILSFCMMGINSVDLFNATEYDGRVLTYYRTKTKGRRMDKVKMVVDIPKILYPLFEKYKDRSGKRIFNFYQSYVNEKAFNKAINKGLKEIGDILRIDDLEYYAARHSWATIALNKVRISKYVVHEALNHIDESMRVTDIYIERDFSNENKANGKVVKYVFGKLYDKIL